jgi:hypothetical protein
MQVCHMLEAGFALIKGLANRFSLYYQCKKRIG